MTLALLLDARWGLCPSCGERHIWKKLREGAQVLWRTSHTTSAGEPCKYFSKEWPTAIGALVEANEDAVVP